MHILIITRHYPPEISGGARRPFLYVKALRQLGHKVTIVTPFKLDDENSITVFNRAINRSMEPKKTQNLFNVFINKFKNYFRTLLYWPDPNITWAHSVIKTLKKRKITADWVFTTSPPESLHIVGKKISTFHNIPWVAEFRDTWIENPHRAILKHSILRRFFERIIAHKTLKKASAVTAVSEKMITEARKYMKPKTPECIISHFSDKIDENINHIFKFDQRKINLVHSGAMTLSDHRRTLGPLLKEIEKAHKLRPEITLHIAGRLSENELKIIKKSSVPVIAHGPISLDNSRIMQTIADALLIYTPYNSPTLPGKYAEYIMAERPILYLGNGWLHLVKDRNNLKPLVPGLLNLKKGDRVYHDFELDDKIAAKQLVEFLNSIIKSK